MKKRPIAALILCLVFAVSLSIGTLALTTTYFYRTLFNCTVRSGAGTGYSSLGTTGIGAKLQGYYPSTTYAYSSATWQKIHWNSGLDISGMIFYVPIRSFTRLTPLR